MRPNLSKWISVVSFVVVIVILVIHQRRDANATAAAQQARQQAVNRYQKAIKRIPAPISGGQPAQPAPPPIEHHAPVHALALDQQIASLQQENTSLLEENAALKQEIADTKKSVESINPATSDPAPANDNSSNLLLEIGTVLGLLTGLSSTVIGWRSEARASREFKQKLMELKNGQEQAASNAV